MAIIISQIALPLGTPEQEACRIALRRLGLVGGSSGAAVCRRSVDARRADRVRMVYSVLVQTPGDEQALLRRVADQKNISLRPLPPPLSVGRGQLPLKHRPVVVGLGPAGLFAALLLARQGLRPLVLERGPDVETRAGKVDRFWREGVLDPEANVQFGEGGAGTFSDGKLTTRISDARVQLVLETLVAHGAPGEVLIEAKPHVGTDRLRGVVRSIRQEIVSLGGEVRFDCKMTGLICEGGVLRGLRTSAGDLPCEAAVVAVGHSARDTVEALHRGGVAMEKKPFSVGARIEHPQQLIDRLFYGRAARHPALPPAEYQLSHRQGDRGCYSFCMCPGGVVVPAASEEGGVVTNGMSDAARDGDRANAAIVASVLPEDIAGGPLEAISFQRGLERAAYALGGGGFAAPAQSAASFLRGDCADSTTGASYARGVRIAPLAPLLPDGITRMLQEGLRVFERRHPGFAGEAALLTGLETRTSSPLRMTRDGALQSPAAAGLYPCGEGAGYAGGIVSSAVDGLRVAAQICETYAPFQ